MTNYVRERTAKIIEEVYNSTYIDKIDTEVLEKILQDALNEYYNEVFTYARNIGYDEGYDDCDTASKSSLAGDVDKWLF